MRERILKLAGAILGVLLAPLLIAYVSSRDARDYLNPLLRTAIAGRASIPYWILTLMFIALGFFLFDYWKKYKEIKGRPDYLRFRRMMRFSVIWEWNWTRIGNEWQPIQDFIRAICPTCGRPLTFGTEYIEHMGNHQTEVLFVRCERSACPFRLSFPPSETQEYEDITTTIRHMAFTNEHELRTVLARDVLHYASSGEWREMQRALPFPPPASLPAPRG